MRCKEILYFAKYVDRYGHQHYAIHMYDTINKHVTMFKDFKFDSI